MATVFIMERMGIFVAVRQSTQFSKLLDVNIVSDLVPTNKQFTIKTRGGLS